MVKRIGIISLCLVAAFQVVRADTTTVSFDSGDFMIFDNPALHGGSDVALSGGTTADGNGDVLQLGYFTGPNFSGTFVPLSGETSLNNATISGSSPAEPYNKTSIGDLNTNGAGDGTFALSLDFVSGNANSGNSLPSAGTQLALRFYNNTTIASSSFYNTVTDASWLWTAPATPPSFVTISLNDSPLIWESIAAKGQAAGTAFHTTIAAIPEPSTIALLGLSLIGVPLARRRFKK
jgi:PEP-CTERM motif